MARHFPVPLVPTPLPSLQRSAAMSPEVVVKVGGSLFDLPHFGRRLRRWLDTLPQQRAVLVPGGGIAAESVRGRRFGPSGRRAMSLAGAAALTFTGTCWRHVYPGASSWPMWPTARAWRGAV